MSDILEINLGKAATLRIRKDSIIATTTKKDSILLYLNNGNTIPITTENADTINKTIWTGATTYVL